MKKRTVTTLIAVFLSVVFTSQTIGGDKKFLLKTNGEHKTPRIAVLEKWGCIAWIKKSGGTMAVYAQRLKFTRKGVVKPDKTPIMLAETGPVPAVVVKDKTDFSIAPCPKKNAFHILVYNPSEVNSGLTLHTVGRKTVESIELFAAVADSGFDGAVAAPDKNGCGLITGEFTINPAKVPVMGTIYYPNILGASPANPDRCIIKGVTSDAGRSFGDVPLPYLPIVRKANDGIAPDIVIISGVQMQEPFLDPDGFPSSTPAICAGAFTQKGWDSGNSVTGNDMILGSGDNLDDLDILSGGGDDIIRGGVGNDILVGGTIRDRDGNTRFQPIQVSPPGTSGFPNNDFTFDVLDELSINGAGITDFADNEDDLEFPTPANTNPSADDITGYLVGYVKKKGRFFAQGVTSAAEKIGKQLKSKKVGKSIPYIKTVLAKDKVLIVYIDGLKAVNKIRLYAIDTAK